MNDQFVCIFPQICHFLYGLRDNLRCGDLWPTVSSRQTVLQTNFTLTVKLGYEIKAQHSNKLTGHGEQSGGKQTNPWALFGLFSHVSITFLINLDKIPG